MALITIIGAGTGISDAVARLFGKKGYTIALLARTESKLQEQVQKLTAQGIKAVYAVADVSEADSLKNALFQIRDTQGHADMILYNAAAVSVKDIVEQDWETIKSQFDVNVGGAFHLAKLVLPFCLKENKGKIFFTGGGFALQGDPQWTSLSIGKAALRNLVQALAKRVENTNVHIAQVTVCGYVNPQDEKYSPDKIAEQYWKLFEQKEGTFENEIMY
ncbi:SDR family NAD(P)-dependent oxidoreductase [Hugenholtzia roseola]|uniref:SDR family NAD(P)-dependent oxidoreductase n=1 Tax=Hugenholtzia roseola TaxID=1002 RepID=UPI0004171295|nr:SDR family NAD(P)-dependent oxidoreductase [Hugenholtzia roseola]